MKLFSIKSFTYKHSTILQAGMFTAVASIMFKIISLFVLYHYLQPDFYICLVAIVFFTAGLFVNKHKGLAKESIASPYNILVRLSAKEIQVLKLIAEGKTNKEIAAIHFIEISTVKTHINNIYTKLSISNRKEARVKYNELSTTHFL